ncbi:RGS22 protein, partial [Pitta sordida]|nr:RGS22 protein [Pitta sordida]
TFAQPVKFNSDSGVFELVNYAPRRLECQLKKTLHDQKPLNSIYDVLRKAKNDGQLSKMHSTSPTFNIDPNYNTMCLDREQVIQWIKKERLPAFLGSDCYFEYRLAKLISQVEWSKTGINFIIDNDYYPWIRKQDPSSFPAEEDNTSLTMKKFYVSLGQATVSQVKDWFTLAKLGDLTKTTDSSTHPVVSTQIQDTQRWSGQNERDESLSEEDTFLEAGSLPEDCQRQCFLSPSRTASAKASVTSERSREAEEAVAHQPDADIESNLKFHKQPEIFTHKLANNEFACSTIESLFKLSSSPLTTLDSKEDVSKQDPEEVSLSSSSESGGPDSRAAWCISHGTYDAGNRHEFERFKKFIKGTSGERYWWLWMDIERLKSLKNTTRQQRQLSKMKKQYLLSSGDYFLSLELLLRLDLLHGDQWNITHLSQIQPEVVKPLLLYWGPRFCVTHSTAIEAASAKLKFWHTCQERPRVDIDPFPQIVSLLPLTKRRPPSLLQKSKANSPTTLLKLAKPNFSLKRSSRLPPTRTSSQGPQHIDISSSRMWSKSVSTDMIHCLALDGTKDSGYQSYRKYTYADLLHGKSAAGSVATGESRMESMLQSLYLENRAGYYFTQFCERSGNKLWKNCVYFWFDLQAYHQLFYQETLQPFQICKQAQYLYATYIAPSASMDIGLHQNKKNMIYQKIDPAFEDLFDPAEEYILTILLEPWMKMVEADKYASGKVELVEETQQLDSVCFRKVQALQQASGSKKDESAVADTGPPPCPDDLLLHQVPKELAGPNLSDLIHDKEKLKQFWAFLDEHSAGMDLMCWLDIEEFRKMFHKDKEKSDEKSEDIKNKYLNSKYFFGPNSPATREQQEKLTHSCGGRRQILQDQLSAAVLLEVQQCVQKRLEKQWLPLFLADEHYGVEGQAKHVDNKCVSSSSEVIAFRKALLDPVTAKQFQRFVSLQGDLLGNGVLFWQEVQKYKDLCHSHCADAIVQKKITAIISCFINSAIPPALQIDIPPEQAKKILEHRKELGPYIFREAQMSVFALLFKFWPEFCKFQSNLESEKILLVLKREKGRKMRKKEGVTTKVRLARFTDGQQSKTTLTQQPTNALVDKIDMKRGSASSLDEHGCQASWSYSKYIEALEQERILIKRQEDLEKTSSPFLAG